MKKLLASFLICLSFASHAVYDSNDFNTCTEFGFNKYYGTQYMTVWMNTYWQDQLGLNVWPKNQWTTVDASGYVKPGSKNIFVSSLHLITMGGVLETANMSVAFRRHGAGSYAGKGNGWLNPSDYPSNPDLQTGSARYTEQSAIVRDPSWQYPQGPNYRGSSYDVVPLDENGKFDIYIGVATPIAAGHTIYGLNVNIQGWCK